MKPILCAFLLWAGSMHANAQLLNKIKTQVDHTAGLVKTTAINKADDRFTQAAAQKTDNLMDKVLSPKISFKKKKKQAAPPPTDSTITAAPAAIDSLSQKDH